MVENLEHTKKTADEIELKVIESKKTSSEIDKVIHLKPIIIDMAASKGERVL